ncbi:protein OBERON 2 [Andrographis paniculata]|uniref:protein OBERON 2 n=1 Tax=Andrographis paniculata TaxID=175694 RepID=UPI0021E85C89|nr:protein OBERON 2 [Andrographis paniculata]XP_051152917.1 protein OBERON 2 [Andrographis paniculata]XP_051152918.1 protein OBERON 2 [Andrographis paniculata]
MIRELETESMEIDNPGGSEADTSLLDEKALVLYPVSANHSGAGLPYAPEDWPNPGDKWGWKTGKRVSSSGHFLDRYLYLPKRLSSAGPVKPFASRLAVEQFIKKKFPNADVGAFFASFSWRIPSTVFVRDSKGRFKCPKKSVEDLGSGTPISEEQCKAGNRSCSSLSKGADSVSELMYCDICCDEPGFCRECCCILCCQTIDKACTHSYIRCEANVEGFICGHHCHIECALRAYMAGTVGGSTNLDAEFYCRRCDSRTDLISHVRRLLETYESLDSRDAIEKFLKVGICVLRGSKRTSAMQLLHHIESAMSKLNDGALLEDIWKKGNISAETRGLSPNANGSSKVPRNEEPQVCETSSPQPFSSNFDYRVESLKLEDKIDRILEALRKSQEIEYRLAEEKLSARKNYILNLYQQLETDKCALSKHTSYNDCKSLLDVVQDRIDSIKQEVSSLRDMAKAAKGFGRVPKRILKEKFDLDVED